MKTPEANQSKFTIAGTPSFLELGAYEALWDDGATSFRSLAKLFASKEGALPSSFVDGDTAKKYAGEVLSRFQGEGLNNFGVRFFGDGEYPARLRDATHPLALFCFQGNWNLVQSPRLVAVIGTRNPSKEGVRRVRKLVRNLLMDDVVVVSGLAKGIDTEAHETTIAGGGSTIAVLGTPLTSFYPKENIELQRKIGKGHLLISQIPVERYYRFSNPRYNRHFFLERNITMSALTNATVIVEAGAKSGTHAQARAALKQGRKLFILDSCFKDPAQNWPHEFQEKGAIRVKRYEDIRNELLF